MQLFLRRLTFVVIPDASHSVKRYRIPVFILILASIMVALLAVCTSVFIYLLSEHSDYIKELQSRLTATEAIHNKQLIDKEEQILTLQTDLYALSEQAKSIEYKMTEISELELQLKAIAGIKESTVRISSIEPEDGGQGGEELELPHLSLDSFADETIKNFTNLSEQLTKLKPSLEATKQAVILHKKILSATPTIWPADSRKVTSLFGVRKDPFTRRTTYHNGLDLGGKTGDPIYAAADGVVTVSERSYPEGNNIIIDHGSGILTRYMHLSNRMVKVGDQVLKGQQIGKLGSTGRSTGPHLHYEVTVNGTHVNPTSYISEDREEP